ncbi:MAG TPA: peptidoglycan DD-metalloendopeptidase family protein [Alphaproteobacteria bacterium]
MFERSRPVLFALLIFASTIHPLPVFAKLSPQEELRQLERDLASERKESDAYREANEKAQKLLDQLQKKLVDQTAQLQATEKELLIVQENNVATNEAITNMEAALKKQHKSLADLLIAAQRLDRVPPEALLLRPGRPIDAARANLLLQRSTPDIAAQVTAIRSDLQKLEELKQKLAAQETELASLRASQRKQQAKMNSDIKSRQALLAATLKKARASQDNIAKMNKEAGDLRTMLADLAKRPAPVVAPRSTPAIRYNKEDEKPHWGQSVMSFFRRGQGPSKMPLMGTLRTGYGEKLASGANSQGLSIGGTPGGVVVAPEKGVVRFAGPFRQYRLLVILEHSNGYHSLLGGLGEVYTKVGNTVAAGEPIGKLNKDAAHANLYYEVRQNGKPVDPRRAVRG